MAAMAGKVIAKKLFRETAANMQGQEDPYFETVPATRLGGLYKTTKKRRRALPPGLTREEEKVLTKVKRRAYRLDLCLFSFLGARFGWSSVIGLIPGFGDIADALLACMVFRTACSVQPPLKQRTKVWMALNIAIDFVIGLVPLLGDFMDALYKCNTRNAILLEAELRERGKQRLKANAQHDVVDPSLPDEFDDQNEGHLLTQQNGPPPRYTSTRRSSKSPRDGRDRRHDLEAAADVPRPKPARTR